MKYKSQLPASATFSHYESTRFYKIEIYKSKRRKFEVVYEKNRPDKIKEIYSYPL